MLLTVELFKVKSVYSNGLAEQYRRWFRVSQRSLANKKGFRLMEKPRGQEVTHFQGLSGAVKPILNSNLHSTNSKGESHNSPKQSSPHSIRDSLQLGSRKDKMSICWIRELINEWLWVVYDGVQSFSLAVENMGWLPYGWNGAFVNDDYLAKGSSSTTDSFSVRQSAS